MDKVDNSLELDHVEDFAEESSHDVSYLPNLCDVNWIKRKSPPKVIEPTSGKLTAADLFCGCGGLTLGAQEAARTNLLSFDIRFAVDLSKAAIQVYRENFELTDRTAIGADIADLIPNDPGQKFSQSERQLACELQDLDIVLAGPPCQGHSDLNNRSRRDDQRNELYLRVIRFAEIVRPKAVVIENVPTVIHDQRKTPIKARDWLSKLGYMSYSPNVGQIRG